MERQGQEVHITAEEARGGSTPHVVRYVLAISLVLAILALSLIWITGAVSSPGHSPDNATTYNQAESSPATSPAP